METAKSPQKSITFLWRVQPLPLRWADGPDEVPPWDVSRGFPLEVPMSYTTAPALEVRTEPGVTGARRAGDMLTLGPDASEVDTLRPLLHGHVDFENTADTWEPGPPPATGYPRLVRADFTTFWTAEYADDTNLLGELTYLAGFIPHWREGRRVARLKNAVLKLASRSGLSPVPHENTLESWLGLAAYVRATKQARAIFDKEGLAGLRAWLEGELAELDARRVVDERATQRAEEEAARAVRGPAPVLAVMRRDWDAADWGVWRALRGLQEVTTRTKNAHSFRGDVAGFLYSVFDGHVRSEPAWGYGLEPHMGRVTATCSPHAYAHAHAKLAELWVGDKGVRLCEVCGAPFVPNHGNRTQCGAGRCGSAKHRKERQARGG